MENIERPQLVETYKVLGSINHTVNINITESENGYTWEAVHVPAGRWNYSGVVDALVQHKYPTDLMQATINNYLLDPSDEYAVSEFNKMQAWRKEAKEIAKEALLYGMS